MIKFPNCKINIGLNILRKREDGYHDLQTVFYPIAIFDALELVENRQREKQVEFIQTGSDISGDPSDNICVKAYHLLKTDFPGLPAVTIHLHKTIPVGAGLGGGSSDAAFTLKLLNEKFQLGLSRDRLTRYASALGSDCPFFMMDTACMATGRGEILNSIDLDLSGYRILIVNPRIHVNTADAFRHIEPRATELDLELVLQTPVDSWKNQLVNDFEASVFKKYPEIAAIKKEMYQQGALYASMSGSGSSVYGIFAKGFQPVINYPSSYFLRWI